MNLSAAAPGRLAARRGAVGSARCGGRTVLSALGVADALRLLGNSVPSSRVIAPDQRGHGDADRPQTTENITKHY
ncbi:hypothetical protein [Streptomyces clavuligerus]|uniref:hypothetical protein n=1 Tax=Streptomyces clavuligerus TaxID=1901 RepID=UPI0002D8462A|nr:hypothetical protein [Streptomyces clavuligerus]